MAAALEAADLGARVTLFERQRRLGGLTWSFERNGVTMDNGQHVYLSCCDAYIRFLRRIGAQDDVEPPRALDVPVVAPGPSGPVTGRLRRNALPVPLHLAGSLLRYPHLTLLERAGLGRALAGLARLDLDDPRLDDVTFGEWLRRRGQSSTAVSAVWDLITIPTVNLPAAEASLAAAAMVFKTGVLGGTTAVDIGWSRVPLGQLHGGRGPIALSKAGVEVFTGTRVTAISEQPGAGWGLQVQGTAVSADAVVVAVPHEEAAELVPPTAAPDSRRWPELGYSAVVDVHLIFDRAVTSWDVMAGHRSDVQWVFDRTRASGLGRTRPGEQYLAVSLSAADHLLGVRPDALVTTTVEALGRLLPAVRNARLVDSVVTKERKATFRARPGSAGLRPLAATRRPGLVLAGAWTATGWPATMEGAVRSGVAAARALPSSSSSITAPLTQEVA
jgi:squalene-associated FAD-dependent desaturase